MVNITIAKCERTRGGKSVVNECCVFVCEGDKAVSVKDVGLCVLSQCLVLIPVKITGQSVLYFILLFMCESAPQLLRFIW